MGVLTAASISKEWRLSEKRSKDAAAVLQEYDKACKRAAGTFSLLHWLLPALNPSRQAFHDYEYFNIRTAFIMPKGDNAQELPKEFDFSLYLVIILGETIGAIVEIFPLTWLVLECVFILFWAVTALPQKVVAFLFLLLGYTLLFTFIVVAKKLDWMRSQLIPPPPKQRPVEMSFTDSGVNESSPLINESGGSDANSFSIPPPRKKKKQQPRHKAVMKGNRHSRSRIMAKQRDMIQLPPYLSQTVHKRSALG